MPYVVPNDLPESCYSCPFNRVTWQHPWWSIHTDKAGKMETTCNIDKLNRAEVIDINDKTYKAPWCPLRPIQVAKENSDGMYIQLSEAKKLLNNDYAYAAASLLDEVPIADVREESHASWKSVECGTICTHCNRVYDKDFEFPEDKIKSYFKRCPECGSIMDEE